MRPAIVTFALAALATLLPLGGGATPLHAQALTQQYGRKQVDKGPRALGLVQISATGKARIIPITIMIDGKFFDAGSYHATPVPMALDFGIVYEGFRSGVSQGLFTITQPGQMSRNWIAEGTWLPAGAKAPETSKKYAAPVIDEDKSDDRPTLHRRKGSSDRDDEKPAPPPATPSPSTSPSTGGTPPATNTPPASAPTTSTPPAGTASSTPPASTPPSTTTPASPPASTPPAPAAKDSTKDSAKAADDSSRRSSAGEPFNDPNRPVLRRGKPDPSAHHEPFVNFDDPAEVAKATKEATADTPSVQVVTAISDAGGPDARPYTYDVKPAEEAIYRNKMLELAAKQLGPKTQAAAAKAPSSTAMAKGTAKKPSAAKLAQPQFEDLHLRIFDLSNSNEPILVLSAKTHPSPASASGSVPEPQEITLIARTNLEGELQKLFFAQTDSRHLDIRPRMELIDAVDADGDGRGELLFRQITDGGSTYAIYRVTANQLWPLYEGAR